MSSHSRKGAPGNDSFVEQLGDRLSSDGDRKVLPLRRPDPPAEPKSRSGRPPRRPSGEHHAVVPPSDAFPPPPDNFAMSSAHKTDREPPEFDDATEANPPAPLAAQSDIHQVPIANGADDVLDTSVPYVEHPGADDPFAQFEDELDGESTRIDTQHLIAEQTTHILEESPDPPYLEVESGKDLGKQFVLNPGETSVGRSIDNDVILTDIAVSRRHFKVIAHEDGTLRLHDLGSGNGTQLNGRRVYDAPLSDGDRLGAGESVLIVRIPSEMAVLEESGVGLPRQERSTTDEEALPMPPSPPTMGMPGRPHGPVEKTSFVGEDRSRGVHTDYIQSPGRPGADVSVPRGWLLTGIIVSGLTVALLGAVVTALILRSDEPAPTLVATPAGAGAPSAAAAGDDPFVTGLRAYEQGAWTQAIEAFTRATTASPDDPLAAAYLQKARAAKEHATALASATAALEDGNAERAEAAIAGVPATTPLREELAALRARIVAARDDAEGEAEGSAAEDAAEEGEAAVVESDEPAVRVARAPQRGSRGSAMRAREPVRREARAPVRREAREPAPRSTGNDVEARALALYRSGNFSAAAQLAVTGAESASDVERRSLLRLGERIRTFAAAYQRAEAASFSPAVVRQMQEAVVEDDRISGGHYARRIRPRLIAAYLVQARNALSRNDAGAGCAAVRMALSIDSSNRDARAMSSTCEQRARAIYNEARSLESRNRARAIELYGQVQTMLPRGHALAREAYQRKNELARRSGVDEDE